VKQSRQKHSAAFKAKVALAAIKGGWRTGRRVWRPSQPDPCLEEGTARRRVFENGSERDGKTNEIQVGELYRQIGQLKVENDFLRLGKEAGPSVAR
jgi:transposase